MKPRSNKITQKGENIKQIQGEGPNWVLIVGGALLSTLSIRIGHRLKQAFDGKRLDNAENDLTGTGKPTVKRRPGACALHAHMYSFTQDEDNCYHCRAGMAEGGVEIKRPPTSPLYKDGDPSLPLVAIPVAESNRENGGVLWTSSPEHLELPQKQFHRSNSSDSPCISESGSDIFSKREVIHKLRQQLKRRDDMIMEMQAQITDLQNSLSSHIAHSSHLQSQLDTTNRDLFDSEREIQRLRKAIADHCVADVGSPKKPLPVSNWHADSNGHSNGYMDSINDLDLHCVGVERGSRDGERVELLKREVQELKEVIEGKEFLLQSYKEQKVELSSKVKELQQRLASQVPNIL